MTLEQEERLHTILTILRGILSSIQVVISLLETLKENEK